MLNPTDVLPTSLASLLWVPILLVCVMIARRYLTQRARPRPKRDATLPPEITLTQRSIRTAAETKFFHALQAAVGRQYLIFPQLPLGTLVRAESNNSKAVHAFTNRINLKRVDFALVDSASLKISMAIERDNRNHLPTDRRQQVSRLVRTTLSFCKKFRHHMGAIKYCMRDSTLTTCAA